MASGPAPAGKGSLRTEGCAAEERCSQNGSAVAGRLYAFCCSMRRISVAWECVWMRAGG